MIVDRSLNRCGVTAQVSPSQSECEQCLGIRRRSDTIVMIARGGLGM